MKDDKQFQVIISGLEEVEDILKTVEKNANTALTKLENLITEHDYEELDENQKQIVDDLFDEKMQPLIDKIIRLLN